MWTIYTDAGVPAHQVIELHDKSTINQLVAKRFVKKQQMRWTPRGAHLLLQIRVQALNDDLRTSFERWYPDLRRRHEETLAA